MYRPSFTISNTILKNIGIIEASKEVIDHAPLLPYYEKQFREDAVVRTVHHGTHIEGNELNLSQAKRLLEGKEVVGRDRDIQEVINYRKVMEYINEIQVQANGKLNLSEDTVKKIHMLTVDKILPQEKSGVFRTTQVVVRNSQTGEISFRPPQSIAVPYQVKDLLDFLNSSHEGEIHPVLKSGAIHYEFVRIHPFIDGNGRVARAISTLILFMQGYDIRKFFALEEYFDNDSEKYYEALQSVEKHKGDQTRWLEYFTKGLAIELSKIKEKVESISVDNTIRQRLGGEPLLLSDRQLAIIEYIQKTGYLQNKAFADLFPMVSEDTILNELKVLLSSGIIKKQGITKGAKYLLNTSSS